MNELCVEYGLGGAVLSGRIAALCVLSRLAARLDPHGRKTGWSSAHCARTAANWLAGAQLSITARNVLAVLRKSVGVGRCTALSCLMVSPGGYSRCDASNAPSG